MSVDLGAFPLVRVGSTGGRAWSAEDVEDFFTCTDRAISSRARFVLLHDARGMPRLDAAQQQHILAELAHRKPLIERFLVAYGAVVQSPLERGVLTALSWATPLALPRRIFASEPEATSFLLDCYARVGPRKRPSGEYRIKR
ncbi:MAG TPA: hypothetical protein VFX59_27840, partial [Polyangiales bacterium]|nr:hypothetical protein [Polyangiales bacterium]